MRITSSRVVTKILPSPNLPVRARPRDGAADGLLYVVGDDDLDLGLGDELDLVLRAAVGLCVPALPPGAVHPADSHPDNVGLL